MNAGFYELYTRVIHQLANNDDIEAVLRKFEFALLELLGYGVDFYTEANTGGPLSIHSSYRFVANLGFVEANIDQIPSTLVLSGNTIQSIANNNLQDKQVRRDAKAISRAALRPYLKGKLLKSRELFK